LARQRRDAAARWRGGLPVDNIAVDTLTKEARSRRSEELRLAKRAGDDLDPQAALAAIKTMLRSPIVGDAGLVRFLNRNASRR
jgi:hypothetical protein